MAITRCWDCGLEVKCNDVKQARAKACLHMALAGCIMVFGYTDNDYNEKLKEGHCLICNKELKVDSTDCEREVDYCDGCLTG